MTEAPERIWADTKFERTVAGCLIGTVWDSKGGFAKVEYVRADKVQALVGEAKGLANWSDVILEQVKSLDCNPDDPEALEDAMLGVSMWIDRTRAALAAFTDGGTRG